MRFTHSNNFLCLDSSVATTLAISSVSCLVPQWGACFVYCIWTGLLAKYKLSDHSNSNCCLYLCINLAILYTEKQYCPHAYIYI